MVRRTSVRFRGWLLRLPLPRDRGRQQQCHITRNTSQPLKPISTLCEWLHQPSQFVPGFHCESAFKLVCLGATNDCLIPWPAYEKHPAPAKWLDKRQTVDLDSFDRAGRQRSQCGQELRRISRTEVVEPNEWAVGSTIGEAIQLHLRLKGLTTTCPPSETAPSHPPSPRSCPVTCQSLRRRPGGRRSRRHIGRRRIRVASSST